MAETVQGWLTSRAPHEVCVAARSGSLVKERYRAILERAGIATVKVEADADEALPAEAVRLATMHRLKGLQFPCVLLAGVQRGRVPAAARSDDPTVQRQHLLRERCLLYVAASRARDELVITGFGRPSPLFERA